MRETRLGLILLGFLVASFPSACAAVEFECSKSHLACNAELVAGVALLRNAVARVSPAAPNSFTELRLWLKADAIPSLTDNQPVTTWPDSSGLGLNFTATNTPLFRTNVRGGLPAVSFQAADSDYLSRAYIAQLNPDAFTTAIVAAVGSVAALRAPFNTRGNAPLRGNFMYAETNGRWSISVGNQGATWETLYSEPFVLDDWRILVTSVGSNRFTFHNNGTLEGSRVVLNYSPNNTLTFLLGAGDGPNFYYEGQIAEFIVIGRALSESERAGLECYLSNRYAISVAASCAPG